MYQKQTLVDDGVSTKTLIIQTPRAVVVFFWEHADGLEDGDEPEDGDVAEEDGRGEFEECGAKETDADVAVAGDGKGDRDENERLENGDSQQDDKGDGDGQTDEGSGFSGLHHVGGDACEAEGGGEDARAR